MLHEFVTTHRDAIIARSKQKVKDGRAVRIFVGARQRRPGNDRTGLGLGLSIARKAVQAHGGDITLRNTPGTGCVCIIEIPVTSTGGSPSPPS